jgi:hypothetical protein
VDIPSGLGQTGVALWEGISAVRDVRPEFVPLVVNACRVADRLDAIERELAESPLTVTILDKRGECINEVAQPLLGEHRQQLNVLKTVLASLGVDKLPVIEEEEVPFEERLARAAEALKNPELRVVQ